MKFYIPPQITRLALAFAVFIALFLVVRHQLKPKSFGKYGHYRAESLVDNANIDINYAGHTACYDCHEDIRDLKETDAHSGLHCEICHGPGEKHVNSADAADIIKPTGREFCGRCHSKNAGKSEDVITQIDLKEHNVGKNCTECHNPHAPWEMKN